MNHTQCFTLTLAVLACGTAAAGRINIISEQDVTRSWSRAPNAAMVIAGYPSQVPQPSPNVCLNLGYMIKADGSTSDFVQMKIWSSDPSQLAGSASLEPFVQSAAAAVSMWKFVPTKGKGRSVYTSATFAFDGSKTLSAGQIEEYCRIADLTGFVMKAKEESDKLTGADKQRDARQEMQQAAAGRYY